MMAQHHTITPNPVNVGRGQRVVAKYAHIAVTQIISNQKNEIGQIRALSIEQNHAIIDKNACNQNLMKTTFINTTTIQIAGISF